MPCWVVARSIRVVADFLQAPSARADGMNVPLFPDREQSELRLELQFTRRSTVPGHLQQQARESC